VNRQKNRQKTEVSQSFQKTAGKEWAAPSKKSWALLPYGKLESKPKIIRWSKNKEKPTEKGKRVGVFTCSLVADDLQKGWKGKSNAGEALPHQG